VNRNSGQCLSVGDWNGKFIPIVQNTCDGDYGQQWTTIYGNLGSRLDPGYVVDVLGNSWAAGTPIDLYRFNGGGNQTWQFTQAIG
jgi:hypothetical protein